MLPVIRSPYHRRVAGTIYLGGGGDASDEAPLWRAMLRDKRRVLYWPFALPREQTSSAEGWLTTSLRQLQIDVHLETWRNLDGRDPDSLAWADLLFVGGGNAFDLLDHVRRHRFEQVVRDFVAAGGDFYGGSAGAIFACSDIRIAGEYDANLLGLTDLAALGLLQHRVVLPHYDEHHLAAAQRWSMEYGCPVLGIPERSGVAVRGGHAEVIGGTEVFEVYGSNITPRRPGDNWSITV